jgi:cation transport regulator ChaC
VSTGAGFLGTNLDYLLRTHASLREHRIKDRTIERLKLRCAAQAPHRKRSS